MQVKSSQVVCSVKVRLVESSQVKSSQVVICHPQVESSRVEWSGVESRGDGGVTSVEVVTAVEATAAAMVLTEVTVRR